jgi:hypothetical protein
MGPQPTDTLVAILEECAAVDGGLLYESRDRPGLAFRPLAGLYNAVSTEYDYAAHELAEALAPVEDDQALRNDVVVSRPRGSSARAVRETGANNTQDPPGGVGRYDESVQVNVQADGQLAAQAGWRLHLGTWDEARYPSTVINLARSALTSDATLTAATKALDVGRRATITSPPSGWPPDDIVLLVQGYRERLAQYEWTIDVQGSPALPLSIAEVEHSTYSYFGSDGSTVASSFVAGTGTSLSVAVAAGYPLWEDGDAPFDIMASGVRLTVTSISGSSSPQTFTVNQTPVNGVIKTIPAGATVDVADRSYIGL